MTGEVEANGGFYGTARQDTIFRRLFSLLYDDEMQADDEEIFEWLEGWEDSGLSGEQACLFASLARAQPDAAFEYEVDCVHYDMEEWRHTIEYKAGLLSLESIHIENFHFDEDTGEYKYDQDTISSYKSNVDREGNITEEWLLKECLTMEKEQLSALLDQMENGTEDPDLLINLGILFETGLAGLERDLTTAWNYYLKAAESGDEDAVEFVEDAYPVFFDLAVRENNAGLTAELLEYKDTLE